MFDKTVSDPLVLMTALMLGAQDAKRRRAREAKLPPSPAMIERQERSNWNAAVEEKKNKKKEARKKFTEIIGAENVRDD